MTIEVCVSALIYVVWTLVVVIFTRRVWHNLRSVGVMLLAAIAVLWPIFDQVTDFALRHYATIVALGGHASLFPYSLMSRPGEIVEASFFDHHIISEFAAIHRITKRVLLCVLLLIALVSLGQTRTKKKEA